MISIDQIKQLRQETGASVIECKKALTQAKANLKIAKEILKEWGKNVAGKKSSKEIKEGIIESYVHSSKKIGVMLELNCETDFVAKSPDFQKLAHELCLQIAALDSEDNSLLSQPWIKDETKTIKELIEEYIAKLGENIVIKRFVKYKM